MPRKPVVIESAKNSEQSVSDRDTDRALEAIRAMESRNAISSQVKKEQFDRTMSKVNAGMTNYAESISKWVSLGALAVVLIYFMQDRIILIALSGLGAFIAYVVTIVYNLSIKDGMMVEVRKEFKGDLE